MKIAVEGTIIDTENIYCITDVVLVDNRYSFDIESFNDKTLTVFLKRDLETKTNRKLDNTDDQGVELKRNYDAYVKHMKLMEIKNKEAIEKMREGIYKIWSDDQSKLPKFDLEKLEKDDRY